MAALPTTTSAFGSSATEAQFKTFLTGQRDFLAGLLGTDGVPSTAKSMLGLSDGVTSVNGSAGAISAAQIAAAATSGYGYTPPAPLGYTPAHQDYSFDWVYVWTGTGSGMNFYANWGAGIYYWSSSPGSIVLVTTSKNEAISNGASLYKLRKL